MAAHDLPSRRRTKGSSPLQAPPNRWQSRLLAWKTAIFRGLLLGMIVAHHVLLVVLLLRTAELGWILVGTGDATTPTEWLLAISLACIAWMVASRLWGAVPGLVTAMHDRADRLAKGIKLEPAEHSALFDKVGEVARRVRSPVPDEIWVLAEARCFAFEDRRFGISTRRSLVLALGLPQLLILTTDELCVIVGHELAHVRQQDTTLAVFFFRYAQSLQTSLEEATKRPLYWVNPVLWLDWLAYQLFKVLIAPIQRGQEILADRKSAEVFGGDAARRTLLRDWLVTNKFEALVDQRQEDSSRGKLTEPRTVYQQFLDEWREISHNGQLYLRERLEELEQESYWDTHPALKYRLAAVSAYPNFGADDGRPAWELLGDVPALLQRLGHGPPAEEMDSSSNAVVV